MAARVRVDPDTTIGELVGRLADDSRRLARNEVRLAKMEIADSVQTAGRGALWLGIAFGALVISFVALAIFLATGLSRLFGGVLWAGTLVTAGMLLVLGGLMIFGGLRTLKEQPYTLDETREELRSTTQWLARERERSN